MPPRCRGPLCGSTNPMQYPDRKIHGLPGLEDRGGILLARRGRSGRDFTEDQLWHKAKAIDLMIKRFERDCKRANAFKSLEFTGKLTVLLNPIKARGQLLRLDFLYYNWTKESNIGGTVERLIGAGKLDWAVMDKMRDRFPEINWPKKPWGPEDLPKDWRDVSRDKLRAPHTWPQKWRADKMKERIRRRGIYQIQVYGEFVLLNFDVLYRKEISRMDARWLTKPHGDLELFMSVGKRLWNEWVRISKSVASWTKLPVPTDVERKTRATDCKRAIPTMKQFRKIFERAHRGEFAKIMREAIDLRIATCNEWIAAENPLGL